MLTWLPDPNPAPWHRVQADEVWREGPIVAFDAEALREVVGYECAVIGPVPLAGLRWQAEASGLWVSAPMSLVDAFAPVLIEYQLTSSPA